MINLLIYLLGVAGTFGGLFEQTSAIADWGHFDPLRFRLWQLISYQFIHDPHGILHIAANMLFLWVFGCAVEDRLGRVGFLAFYLVGGVAAGVGHMISSDAPVIGASGSIAAVSGAFLALFPRSRVLVFIIILGLVPIPALWFIGLYFSLDVLKQLGVWLDVSGGRVAYLAHLVGYIYGFGISFTLLATRMLRREEFDIFFLFKQARRRAAFRSATRHTAAGPWNAPQADTGRRLQKQAATAPPIDDEQLAVAEQRATVHRHLTEGRLEAAAAAYRTLLEKATDRGGAILGETHQLDIASQLTAEGAHLEAATAYEIFLASYANSGQASETRLMLGLLYGRRLDRPDRARTLIDEAKPGLRNPSHLVLADQLLEELGPA